MKDINSVMLAVIVMQAKTFIDSILSNQKLFGKDFNPNYKVAFLALQKAVEGFLKVVRNSNETLMLYANSFSVMVIRLAEAKPDDRIKILESLDFLARNSHVYEETTEDLVEKVKMVSEISDKVFEFKPLELKKLHNKIVNTPTKKNEKL